MKASELMIGDWVRCTDPKPFRITDIETECGTPHFIVNNTDRLGINGGNLRPIPLTAEILEKNGFKYDELPKFAVNEITEKTKMTFSYHSGSRTVFVGVNEPNFNLTSACVLYVHELQHILRQSRIEKEIIL